MRLGVVEIEVVDPVGALEVPMEQRYSCLRGICLLSERQNGV
jgi:hypothetical protein